MTELEIKEMIKVYNDLQNQSKEINDKMAELKTSIIEELTNKDETTFESDGVVAQIVNKETIKYNDELAIIKYLKDNGLSRFVVEKIDTTSMNKEIKNSATLNESLSSYITKSVAPTLIVKEIK